MLVTFFISRAKDHRHEGEWRGKVQSDLTYIRESQSRIDENLKIIQPISDRLTKTEAGTKAAHRRLDEITARITAIENKAMTATASDTRI